MTQLFVLLITVLTAMACALMGNFLVLRRLSLVGDAISHAVLPGIIIAFFFAGSLESPLFFLFAVVFAVLMAVIIQWIVERSRVSQESIIGIVFTALFALGVVLLVRYVDNVHLDQDAVLYGQVEFSAWNKLVVRGVDLGPRSLWTMGAVFILNLLAILGFYKELKITTFDPGAADSLGISSKKMHYLIVILTSITIVAAFEAVGAILVVALLVVPAATAFLVSNRLHYMILLSLFFALLSGIGGYLFAIFIDGSVAGSVAMVAGVLLMLIVLVNKGIIFFLKRKRTAGNL
jgi:manganese/zinc/iron transport system permease protein